ncbi:MAG: hypothetical protein ACTSVK_18170 [Promethearchaeota archaeon]
MSSKNENDTEIFMKTILQNIKYILNRIDDIERRLTKIENKDMTKKVQENDFDQKKVFTFGVSFDSQLPNEVSLMPINSFPIEMGPNLTPGQNIVFQNRFQILSSYKRTKKRISSFKNYSVEISDDDLYGLSEKRYTFD